MTQPSKPKFHAYKNTLVVLDGNWLINRCFMTNRSHDAAKAVAKQVVAWVFEYCVVHRATHVLLAIDGDHNFRKVIYPLYKTTRNKAAKAKAADEGTEYGGNPAYACLPILFDLCRRLNIPVAHLDPYEADDVLCSAAHCFAGPDCKVVLVTKDKDMVQALDEHTIIWLPTMQGQPPVTMTHKNVVKYDYAFTPKQFLAYQMLIGDPMDDVPALMKPAQAKAVLTEHGALRAWFKTKEGKAWYMKNQAELLRNKDLVSMCKTALTSMPLSFCKLKTVDGEDSIKPKDYWNAFGAAKQGSRSLFG